MDRMVGWDEMRLDEVRKRKGGRERESERKGERDAISLDSTK